MKDYRIKVTIRNDRLLTAMESDGYLSVAQFTKAHGLDYMRTSEIFRGKLKPLNSKGELIPLAEEILSILNLSTHEAFTERQLKGFIRTTYEKSVKEKELLKLVNPVQNHELLMMEKDINKIISEMLSELPPRSENIVRRVNGIGQVCESSYREIAAELGCTQSRIGQIYQKALRMLTRPHNLEKLKEAGVRDVYGLFTRKEKRKEVNQAVL